LFLSLCIVAGGAYADDKKADEKKTEEKKTGELTDPLEILKKVDASAKAVKTVKYDVSVGATGGIAARVAEVEASFLVSGYVAGAPEKFMAHAKVKLPGSAEAVEISAGTDNDMFFIVDHRNKKAYEDIDPAVMGQAGNVFRQAQMIEFVHDTPFNDEINGRSRELKGSQTIGGVDCYEVHVVYAAEQSPEAMWCFSKKDFLPRRRIDVYTMPDGQKATVTRTITNLVVDPKLDEDAFKLKLPEGFTKTDDFAPNLLAPQ
jgi:hypothetical protein